MYDKFVFLKGFLGISGICNLSIISHSFDRVSVKKVCSIGNQTRGAVIWALQGISRNHGQVLAGLAALG